MAKRSGALPYDIALSFAGEDRKFASAIAELLRSNGVKVFYDEYEKAQLWGKDLYQYLQEIYRDKAKFCVVIVSSHYLAKQWTRHELKQAQARAFAQTTEYILPIKFDTAELPGLTITTGYIDAANTPLPEIIRLILEKLGISKVDIQDRLISFLSVHSVCRSSSSSCLAACNGGRFSIVTIFSVIVLWPHCTVFGLKIASPSRPSE